ncbi:hypothetical protein EYF80_043265 [Liparis tanakae]|uniref:Uncharacterized protein n=1 Tax=Liparis tanakae TaxID=230148 RepID=A0A4Z2G0W8_9TELE|nr:hypothetical protein EYF80_043265 [Liparis tanakae]
MKETGIVPGHADDAIRLVQQNVGQHAPVAVHHDHLSICSTKQHLERIERDKSITVGDESLGAIMGPGVSQLANCRKEDTLRHGLLQCCCGRHCSPGLLLGDWELTRAEKTTSKDSVGLQWSQQK